MSKEKVVWIVNAGWERPKPYVWWRWLFSFCWGGPIRQLRILGFYVTFSKMVLSS